MNPSVPALLITSLYRPSRSKTKPDPKGADCKSFHTNCRYTFFFCHLLFLFDSTMLLTCVCTLNWTNHIRYIKFTPVMVFKRRQVFFIYLTYIYIYIYIHTYIYYSELDVLRNIWKLLDKNLENNSWTFDNNIQLRLSNNQKSNISM